MFKRASLEIRDCPSQEGEDVSLPTLSVQIPYCPNFAHFAID